MPQTSVHTQESSDYIMSQECLFEGNSFAFIIGSKILETFYVISSFQEAGVKDLRHHLAVAVVIIIV